MFPPQGRSPLPSSPTAQPSLCADSIRLFAGALGKMVRSTVRREDADTPQVKCDNCNRWVYLDETGYKTLREARAADGFMCTLCVSDATSAAKLDALETETMKLRELITRLQEQILVLNTQLARSGVISEQRSSGPELQSSRPSESTSALVPSSPSECAQEIALESQQQPPRRAEPTVLPIQALGAGSSTQDESGINNLSNVADKPLATAPEVTSFRDANLDAAPNSSEDEPPRKHLEERTPARKPDIQKSAAHESSGTSPDEVAFGTGQGDTQLNASSKNNLRQNSQEKLPNALDVEESCDLGHAQLKGTRGKTHRKLRRNERNKASQWNTPERISGGAQALTIAGKNPDKPQVANDQHGHQNARGCPPQSRQREVVMAGDKNVSLLAETLMAETGSRGTFEFLYGAKTTMADAVRYATDFEKKAPSTQRQYILHAGIHDVLQGTSEGITDILSREWSGRRGQLTVCSIPEITSRGGEVRAAIVLANAKLKKWCRKTGQRFIDMNKIELPIGYGKDGFHYSEDSTRLISRLIGQSLVRFLDRGGPPRLGKPKPLTRMLSKEGQLPVQHGHKRGDPKQGTGVMHHTQKRPVNKNQQRRKSGTNQHQMELVQLIAQSLESILAKKWPTQ